MRSHRGGLGVAVIVTFGLLAACAGDNDAAPSTATQQTQGPPPSSSTTSTPAPASTSTTTTVLPTMPTLPVGERVAFSLPPTFAAAGVDIPVVVSADIETAGVDVVDTSGAVLTSLLPASPQFWMGVIPGSAVVGPDLGVTPVAYASDGQSTLGPPVSIVVLPANGATLDRRLADAVTTVVYDRPFSSAEGELDWIPAEGGGINFNPPGLARVDENEVAVLDYASSRVTCFDLTGESTCTVPLPVAASGDMFPIGDGTLAVIGLDNRDGHQEMNVLRADPRSELADVIYHEYPLEVAGYPGIATNIGFTWDPPTRTAWVGIPESPRASDVPDPTRFPYTDALHLDPDGVTRGPTVQRPALRPDIATAQPGFYRLLDGNSWVTFYDSPAHYYSSMGSETTASGVIWMLVGIGDSNGATMELARWRPGAAYFEAFPIDYHYGELSTRVLAALDDDTVVVLDMNRSNPGSRIRAFTFPTLAPR